MLSAHGGLHPPSLLSIPARCLEALEFTAFSLTRWNQGGLLKVLLASSLAGVASESYLILPLTPRSGSHRDDTQEQPTRADEERSLYLSLCREPDLSALEPGQETLVRGGSGLRGITAYCWKYVSLVK